MLDGAIIAWFSGPVCIRLVEIAVSQQAAIEDYWSKGGSKSLAQSFSAGRIAHSIPLGHRLMTIILSNLNRFKNCNFTGR